MSSSNNGWNSSEQHERLLENQTDSLATGLHDKVSRIKQITIQMQDSMHQEEEVLENLGGSFDSIRNDISRTSKKLQLVMQTPQGRRMMMIAGGVVLFFLFVYYVSRMGSAHRDENVHGNKKITTRLLQNFPVDLQVTKKYGRMVVASQDLDIGQEIISEIATAYCIMKQSAQDYCQHCFAKINVNKTKTALGIVVQDKIITCLDCRKQCYWCSEECKDNDSLHKDACKYLGCISGVAGAASVDFDLLKLVVIILVQSQREIIGTPIKCLYDLVSHYSSQPEAFKSCLLAACTDFISEFPNDPLISSTSPEHMVKLACKINSNSHALTDPVTNQTIGVGMFPLIAMGNHSCTPNCVFINNSGTLTLKSIKNIKSGEQITVSYVDLFAPRWERRGKLLESKHFWCECSRCVENDKDLLLDAIKCPSSDCNGYCIGDGDLTCESCSSIITSDQAASILQGINTQVDYGMEMYGAGMFESASIALQASHDIAISLLHPHHGIFPSLLVNLVNLYCKTNKLVLALRTCEEAVNRMKNIASDADLGLLPELKVLYEKYVELADIVIEAVKEKLIEANEVDIDDIRALREEAIKQSDMIGQAVSTNNK